MSFLQTKFLQSQFFTQLKETLALQAEKFFASGDEQEEDKQITAPLQPMPFFQVNLFVNKAIVNHQLVQLNIKNQNGIETLAGYLSYRQINSQQILLLHHDNIIRPLKLTDILFLQLISNPNYQPKLGLA